MEFLKKSFIQKFGCSEFLFEHLIKRASKRIETKKSEPLMKPYTSEAQRRWAHTEAGTKALGGKEAVRHWDKESKSKGLPEKIEKNNPKKLYHITDNPKFALDPNYYDKLKTIEKNLPHQKISRHFLSTSKDPKPALEAEIPRLKWREGYIDPNQVGDESNLPLIGNREIQAKKYSKLQSEPPHVIARELPDGSYEILDGRRRVRAAAIKGKKVKAYVGFDKSEPLMKPYTSEAQRRWAHTPAGMKALGGKEAVRHWDKETKGKKLPEKVEKAKVYHGTFNDFKPEDLRPSKGGFYGPGYYVSARKKDVYNYGDKIHEYDVNPKLFDTTNPQHISDFAHKIGLDISRSKRPDYHDLGMALRDKFPNEDLVGNAAYEKLNSLLRNHGYNGVKFRHNNSDQNMVLFDKPTPVKKIKSRNLPSKIKKALSPEEIKSQGYSFKWYKRNPGYHVIQVFHGKNKVGHIAYTKDSVGNSLSNDFGYHRVRVGHVEPEHQGKGLYQHMLNMAKEHVKSLGSKGLMSEGYQRSKAATRAWDKVATHANPYTNNAMAGRKLSAEDSDYYLAASELKKNKAAAVALAGVLGATSPAASQEKPRTVNVKQDVFHNKMMSTLAEVESSQNRAAQHQRLPASGIHEGTRAFGMYGITPIVIKETARLNRDLASKHPDLLTLPPNRVNEYLKKNPGLEDEIASKHLKRLRSHFGDDPAKIGYAWLNGITGTKQAINEKRPIHEHWHVKKILNSFKKQGQNFQKSNYGPRSMNLYSHTDNARRKIGRTGETVSAGPNAAVKFAGPTRSQQAEMQAKIDRQKSRKNPVRLFSPEERKELASKRGLLAASEMEKGPAEKKQEAPDQRSLKPLLKPMAKAAPKVNLNPEHGKIIADAYHNMKHDPNNPQVKAAYGALINETKQQFKDMLDRGLKISKVTDPKHNPYPTSKHLHADVDKGHMWLFPTELGFGSEDDMPKDHPMLQPTEFMHEGKPLLANDVFRLVHDSIHHKLRNGFGPKGEHESFLEHKKMYSPLAQKALATETMGQNSYVNFSSQIGHLNQAKPGSAYAPQKAGLLGDDILNGKWHT